jgi:predicted DNA-binding protein
MKGEIEKHLQVIANRMGRTKSYCVRKAVEWYIRAYEQEQDKNKSERQISSSGLQ